MNRCFVRGRVEKQTHKQTNINILIFTGEHGKLQHYTTTTTLHTVEEQCSDNMKHGEFVMCYSWII